MVPLWGLRPEMGSAPLIDSRPLLIERSFHRRNRPGIPPEMDWGLHAR